MPKNRPANMGSKSAAVARHFPNFSSPSPPTAPERHMQNSIHWPPVSRPPPQPAPTPRNHDQPASAGFDHGVARGLDFRNGVTVFAVKRGSFFIALAIVVLPKMFSRHLPCRRQCGIESFAIVIGYNAHVQWSAGGVRAFHDKNPCRAR